MRKSIIYVAALLGTTALAPIPAPTPVHAAGSAFAVSGITRHDITDLGAAPEATRVSIAVTLKYRNQAELDDVVRLQATPGSPRYHQFMTPDAFAARFAPSQADFDRVVASLTQAGFTITRGFANRTVIDAQASPAVASRYFGTTIDAVVQTGHGTRYANTTRATVPDALADTVSTVLGLDNLVKFHTHHHRGSDVPVGAADARAASNGLPVERIVGGAFAGIYPGGIEAAYNYPSLGSINGAGHAIGIVIDSDIGQASLTTFWAAAGITRTGSFNRVLVNGKNPGVNGDSAETAIDTETTSSLAPGANIYVYLISSLSDADIEDAYNLAVTNHNLDVISSSFGGCELGDTPFATATDAIAEQGAAIGLTFTASTGDSGGFCEGETNTGKIFYSKDIVDSPASGPHFVAVGGTKLTINKTTGVRVTETAWAPGGASGGGGGGVSSLFALPSYQTGVQGITVVPAITVKGPNYQPNSGFAGRNVPDISLDASNASGSYIAVYDAGWTGYGGTSVSNPCFAALVALQNQVNGSLAGYLNTALYATYTNNGASPAGIYGADFHDITSGSIGGGWKAKKGYDQATGIGSIFNGAF
jgi:kumamolisin